MSSWRRGPRGCRAPLAGDSEGSARGEAVGLGTRGKEALHELSARGRWEQQQGGQSSRAGAWQVPLSPRTRWSLEDQVRVSWGGEGGGCLQVRGRRGRFEGGGVDSNARQGSPKLRPSPGCLSPTCGPGLSALLEGRPVPTPAACCADRVQ